MPLWTTTFPVNRHDRWSTSVTAAVTVAICDGDTAVSYPMVIEPVNESGDVGDDGEAICNGDSNFAKISFSACIDAQWCLYKAHSRGHFIGTYLDISLHVEGYGTL